MIHFYRMEVLGILSIIICSCLGLSGHVNVSIQGVSWASMAGSHSACFIWIAIGLVSISYFPKHCSEWWTHPKAVVSWHECYSNMKMIESLTRQEQCKAWCVVVSAPCTFQLTAWNFTGQSLYRMVEQWSVPCRVLFHCEVLHHSTSVKGYNCWSLSRGCILVSGVLTACCQLRFSLCSGGVITKAPATVVSLY